MSFEGKDGKFTKFLFSNYSIVLLISSIFIDSIKNFFTKGAIIWSAYKCAYINKKN